MANQPRIETPTGTVDGVNRIFYTIVSYRPGTPRVFVNGQLKRNDIEDGWVELGSNKVKTNEPPDPTDVVQIYYIPL